MSNADVIVRLSLENKQLSSELAKTERRYKASMKRMEKDTQSFGASVASSMRGLAIGAAAAAGLLLIGRGTAGLVASALNTRAVQEQNNLIRSSPLPSPGLPRDSSSSAPSESKAISGLPQGTPGGSATTADVNASPKLASLNPEKQQALPKRSKQKRKVYKKTRSCCGDAKDRKITLRVGTC